MRLWGRTGFGIHRCFSLSSIFWRYNHLGYPRLPLAGGGLKASTSGNLNSGRKAAASYWFCRGIILPICYIHRSRFFLYCH